LAVQVAGVNNIPWKNTRKRGIPVFYAPGAKLECCSRTDHRGMLLASRNIAPALDFVSCLDGDEETINDLMREIKAFCRFELSGKNPGVLGLGAIGVKVAMLRCSGFKRDRV